jgi:hypothetical protein
MAPVQTAPPVLPALLVSPILGRLRALAVAALPLLPVAAGLALAPAEARAECARAYTGPELINDLSVMNAALRRLDEDAFKVAGQNLEKNLPCIRTPVQPQVFASAYRMVGAYQFLAGDRAVAAKWFRVALELNPAYEWDVTEFPADHPIREAFVAERYRAGEAKVAIAGKALNEPAGSKLFLDGKPLTKPAATTDRPHLLQVVGADNTVRQVYLIVGNAIPEQYLRAEDTAVAVAPTGKKGDKNTPVRADPSDPYAVQKIQRVRPKAKTPLMIAGGAIALGSAGIYGASFATRSSFDEASTTKDLEHYRSLTNTLVIAAGATFAVGIGVEYAAIIIDSNGPALGLRGRF